MIITSALKLTVLNIGMVLIMVFVSEMGGIENKSKIPNKTTQRKINSLYKFYNSRSFPHMSDQLKCDFKDKKMHF